MSVMLLCYGLDDAESNSESDKIPPPPQKITAGPASYSVGAEGSFPLGKAAEA